MSKHAPLSSILFLLSVTPLAIGAAPALAQDVPSDEENEEPNTDLDPAPATDDQQFEPGEYYTIDAVEEEGPDEAEPGEDSDLVNEDGGEPVDAESAGVREPPEIPLLAMAGAEVPPPPAPPPAPGQADEPLPLGRMVPRSLMGRTVLDRQAPWQAQIYFPRIIKKWQVEIDAGRAQAWEKQHYCGGALVAPNWVVTAAHCIDDSMKEAGYRIRLGQEDIQKPGGWEYSIAEVRQHAGYKASNQYKDDIALIRIQRDPKFGQPPTDQVKSIGLFRRPDPWDGQAVWGYGWGKTSEGGSAAHAVLMKVELAVIARPRCSAPPMYDERRIPVTVVCAGAPGRKTCRGDSGGPLVANGQLVGVVSWGSDRCADDKAPGVYTHAGAYAQWIDNVTGGAARAGVAAQ